GNRHGFRPCGPLVGTEAGLVAVWRTAVAVGHQQISVSEAGQEGWKPPDADRVRGGPRLAAGGGLGLEDLAKVVCVVIADVNDDFALGSFNHVQFVIVRGIIAFAGGNFRQPAPALAVVGGFANPDAVFTGPKFLACVKKAAVVKL